MCRRERRAGPEWADQRTRVDWRMPRSERLYHLSCLHALLAVRGYATLADVQAADPERLKLDLHRFHDDIMRLIGEAQPDVMAALFPPDGISWNVWRADAEPRSRFLTIRRKERPKLETKYDYADREAEREAWVMLRDALRA